MNLALQITGVFLRRPSLIKAANFLTKAGQLLGWITYLADDVPEHRPQSVAESVPQPKQPAREVSPQTAAQRSEPTRKTNAEATILLVDDDPGVLKSLARVIRAHGWKVVTARDGAEALLQLNDQPPDLLITDLSMGDVSGWDLLFHEDMQRPRLPVFVITALPVPAIAGANVLAAEFFQKPLDLDALVAAIHRRLDASEQTANPEPKT